MAQTDNFLHTTHRTVAWFNKTDLNKELIIAPPFQRNPVWTEAQKSFLLDTILNGLPIPELYMQDTGNEAGLEEHIVVDGQQRIRSVLDYVQGTFALSGEEVDKRWRGKRFDELNKDDKTGIFSYKFVVRVLPNIDEEQVRKIFTRLNRNVVSLNDQELRNATYWGPFIKTVQKIVDEDPFWSESGIFSANDHRRMLDHEYVSEIVVAILHGEQNKKDRLDYFYALHEEAFEDRDLLPPYLRKITSEIEQLLPNIKQTRWRKKSDFYTLFLALTAKNIELPFAADRRREVSDRLMQFANDVDAILRLEEGAASSYDANATKYARNVARAASDKASRIARSEALKYVFHGLTSVQSITTAAS